jgi:hypothetical protein
VHGIFQLEGEIRTQRAQPNIGELTEGTLLTREFAAKHGKPYLVVQLGVQKVIKQDRVLDWLEEQEIQILNIAAPRELQYTTGIYTEAHRYLHEHFSLVKDRADQS